jgi:hypothetical protein
LCVVADAIRRNQIDGAADVVQTTAEADDDATHLMEKMDTDGSGEISFIEFLRVRLSAGRASVAETQHDFPPVLWRTVNRVGSVWVVCFARTSRAQNGLNSKPYSLG